jgi:hypothetical protein
LTVDAKTNLIFEFFKKIIGPFATTRLAPLIVEPDHIQERILALKNLFDANPQWKEPFRVLIKSLHAQETEISIEEQIRFFTTKHTRLWLMVNLMNEILNLKELKLDEATGRLPGKPDEILKFACTAKAEFGEEGRYKDIAFGSGLIFDFLFWLSKSTLLDLSQFKLDEPISQAFTRAVEQGKKITQLSRHKGKLTHEKLAPFTAFFRQISQVCFYLLKKQEALDFYKNLETVKPTEPLRMAMEKKQFSVHSGMMACYFAESIPGFETLGQTMSIWGFPYLASDPTLLDIHDVTAMGMLGVAVCEGLKGADFGKAGKPSLGMPELAFLDFELTAEVKNEAKI